MRIQKVKEYHSYMISFWAKMQEISEKMNSIIDLSELTENDLAELLYAFAECPYRVQYLSKTMFNPNHTFGNKTLTESQIESVKYYAQLVDDILAERNTVEQNILQDVPTESLTDSEIAEIMGFLAPSLYRFAVARVKIKRDGLK